jgi:hypothetical protein
MATVTEDPIRAEVERVLHAVVDAAVAAPAAAVTALPRCVARQVGALQRRLGEPARVLRSLFDLVGAGSARAVVEPDDAPAPSEPAVELRLVPAHDPRQPAGEHLPIDEYESLAASQVVARLPTLTSSELEAVRSFESAHRGRRTILGKIDQLLA